MTRFKNALLDELVAYAQRPAQVVRPARPRRRQIIRVGSLAGAGVATVISAFLVVPAAQEAAYAVDKNPDGTVTVTIRELGHAADATRDLRAAGVRAQVVQLAAPGSCATTPGGTPAVPGPGSGGWSVGTYPFDVRTWLPQISPTSLTINPSGIPAGAAVFIIEQSTAETNVMLRVSLVDDPAPTCWDVTQGPAPHRAGEPALWIQRREDAPIAGELTRVTPSPIR